jgi:hypothetical protein
MRFAVTEKGVYRMSNIYKSRFTPNLKNGKGVRFEKGEKVRYKTRDGTEYDIVIDSELMYNSGYFGYEAIFPDGRFFALEEGIIDWQKIKIDHTKYTGKISPRGKYRPPFPGYESPITIAMGEVKTRVEESIENNVYTAVQEYGITIDKDELMKALMYDRGQYDKGYYTGYNAAKSDTVRCRDCKHWGGETFGYICKAWSGINTKNHTKPDEFCSRGERKEQK